MQKSGTFENNARLSLAAEQQKIVFEIFFVAVTC